MSTVLSLKDKRFARIHPEAGWVDHRALPKGPGGRALCRQCGQEVPKGRRSFCSDACVHEWRLRTDPGYVAQEVRKRDHGVCAECGLDTERAHKIWSHARWAEWEVTFGVLPWGLPGGVKPEFGRVLLELWGISKPLQRWWEANHKVAVAEGGGLCGLDNYETLCQGCHRHHTAALRKRLAEQRRAQ